MARTGGIVNYNTFVKGLITEASPLTFPENASLREENFELRRNGTRARRYGLDYENGYEIKSTGLPESYLTPTTAMMSYEWHNAGNTENENFLVVQIGSFLYIYSMDGDSVSGSGLAKFIRLDNYKVTTSVLHNTAEYPIDVAPIKGKLVVVSPVIEPIYIDYNAETGTFSTTVITCETRDLFGVVDETPSVDFRPTSLSSKHEYNLRNQGWTAADIATTFADLSVYPSNADIAHIAKNTTYESTTTGYEIEDIGTYNPTYLEKQMFGTTRAPRGKFIYNVFNREYKDLTGGTGVDLASVVFTDASDTLTITTSTTHGLSVGDAVKLKDIDILITWTAEDANGDEETRTVTVAPEYNTINDRSFVVTAVGSTTKFNVIWHFDLSDDVAEVGIWNPSTNLRTAKSIAFTITDSIVVVPGVSIITSGQSEELYRFKCTSGYAGRTWYSGLDGGSYGSYVFFSQVLDDPLRIGLCYQDADPTSEHISDLIDTDGGFIVIPEARNIQALVPMGQFLFIFSTNGVWRIFGDDGGNFRATGYSVEKVSDIGVNSRFSIVPVENEIYYWAIGGIYKIMQAEVSGNYHAINISQLTVQTLFFDIGSVQHRFVKGSYDPVEKKILWLYNRTPNDYESNYKYDSILILDIVLEAFNKYLLPSNPAFDAPHVAGLFNTPNVLLVSDVDNIVTNGDQVVTATGDDVIRTIHPARSQTTQTKYLTVTEDPLNANQIGITFSEFNNTNFLDFEEFDSIGEDAAAYMITGYDTQGSQANKKQVHHILMYFARTEQSISLVGGKMIADNPSGCLVSALWDWATDINSIRAGTQFQAYRLNRYYIPSESADPYTYGEETVVSKSKLRGRGRALSLAIQSEPGKDLHIYGWSMVVSGGQRP